MDFLSLLLFLVPIYVANSSPVVLGGGYPLDFYKNFIDGRRILGDGKTIKGFIAGIVCGSLIGVFIADFYLLPFFSDKMAQVLGSLALAFGTMVGDSLGSFIKRRAGVGNGRPFFLDTIIFLLIALFFVYPFALPSLYAFENLVFVFGLTIILHPLANFFANRAGLKNVPW
ncbi:MAG: CDP-2,3-bis-(O-geranylgeranyl)-sn-glycerol synthase [Candidatus Bilamarchaeaceae archaeon]